MLGKAAATEVALKDVRSHLKGAGPPERPCRRRSTLGCKPL